MNRKEFINILKKKVLLFDGGFGTELYNKGIFINKCFEQLNISNPSLVKQIHTEYVDSGVDVIETNTFGANRPKLEKHQLADKIYEINYQGVKLAKEVSGNNVLVAGSVGPLGIQIEPLGKLSYDEAKHLFKEQIQPLINAGVDLLIFETFIYPKKLKIAIETAREIDPEIPIIAQMTIDDDAHSLTGASPETMIRDLTDTNADVIGVNCTVGPRDILKWLEEVRDLTKMPISIMPNAGKPKSIDGRNIYLTSPEYLGEYTKHYINKGANIIGGCCGTSPEHIRKMRNMISAVNPESSIKHLKFKKEVKKPENVTLINQADKSKLSKKIAEGDFVKFVELLAPRGIDYKQVIARAKKMKDFGIDVINIPDGPRASARMSAMSLALLIQQEIEMETVLHYVCRDRNVIGMQSDLMGAYAMGVKNILAITGDPPKLGNYPDATAVFDVDSIGLTNILNMLNNGMDIAGNPIGKPTGFSIGVGANPGAVNIENEIKRLEWKVDAGAEYVVTQPVFDFKQFESFIENIRHLDIPIIAGLWPLVSLRNAEFMNNEVPGVNVTDEIISRMAQHEGDKEASRNEGVQIARETLQKMMPLIQGVQISAPFGKVDTVIEVLKGMNV